MTRFTILLIPVLLLTACSPGGTPEVQGAFHKLTPIDRSAFQSVWTITISWNASPGASGYEYCFDTTEDDACDSEWMSAGTDTSAEITFLEAETTYYWQVRALADGEDMEADRGAWWEFTTGRNARFHARLAENDIAGYDWRPGSSVTVTVDDPSNGTGVDFTDTGTVDPYGMIVFYDLAGVRVVPGMVITMTDGIVFKSHLVFDLRVSNVDIDLDTISGTGEAGARISVEHCEYNGCLWRRWATVRPDGIWQVDFSVAGPGSDEQEILDIVPGTVGAAQYPDEDADHSEINWHPIQRFDAYPEQDRIQGLGWPLGATLTVMIDDPVTPASPDHSNTIMVIYNPEDPVVTWFDLAFAGQYDLKPGDVVTVTDGTTTKVHVIASLQVTAVDPVADVISGVAAPNSYIDLQTCGDSVCADRTALADSNGDWSVDFSVPGDQPWEQTVFDILSDTVGDLRQWDEDIDATRIQWLVR